MKSKSLASNLILEASYYLKHIANYLRTDMVAIYKLKVGMAKTMQSNDGQTTNYDPVIDKQIVSSMFDAT